MHNDLKIGKQRDSFRIPQLFSRYCDIIQNATEIFKEGWVPESFIWNAQTSENYWWTTIALKKSLFKEICKKN